MIPSRKVFWAGTWILIGMVLLLLFRNQLLTLYADWFVVRDAQPGADAIICLSGDRETRTPECLRLWKEGYAKRLFVTSESRKIKNLTSSS